MWLDSGWGWGGLAKRESRDVSQQAQARPPTAEPEKGWEGTETVPHPSLLPESQGPPV